MGRSLTTTLTKIIALSAVFASTAALVAMQQAHPHRVPAPPPPMQQPQPPRYAPPRPVEQRQPRQDRSVRREGDVRPLEASVKRTDREERRIAEQRERRTAERARIGVVPTSPLHRLKAVPTPHYWERRYNRLFLSISSHRGYIPVTAVSSSVSQLTDFTVKKGAGRYAGWKGYGLVVPPNESVTFNLDHTNLAWFRLIICDKWGGAIPGGLSSLMPQPVPRLTYTNPGFESETIYLIVDDPGWMSSEESPYTLEMARSWNPDLFPEDLGTVVQGIWGVEPTISAEFRRPMMGMPWRI